LIGDFGEPFQLQDQTSLSDPILSRLSGQGSRLQQQELPFKIQEPYKAFKTKQIDHLLIGSRANNTVQRTRTTYQELMAAMPVQRIMTMCKEGDGLLLMGDSN